MKIFNRFICALIVLLKLTTLTSCDAEREEKHAVLDCIVDKIATTDTLTYELYLADPGEVTKYQQVGLMDAGLLEPAKKVKLKDAGSPITALTPLGKKYLMATAESSESKKNVIMACRTVDTVTGLNKIGEKLYEAEYEIYFTDVSPFSKLSARDYSEKEVHSLTVEWKENDCVILTNK